MCYHDSNNKLKEKFGSAQDAYKQSGDYWTSEGYKSDPYPECKQPPKQCADEGGECACTNGFVYYGRGEMKFREMMQYKTEKAFSPGTVGCNNLQFTDVAPGIKKQCFCEKRPPLQPFQQAEEGATNLKCSGKVIYTVLNGKDRHVTFKEGIQTKFAVMQAKEAATGYNCTNQAFNGDPVPGQKKQCFCDQDNVITDEYLKNETKLSQESQRINEGLQDDKQVLQEAAAAEMEVHLVEVQVKNKIAAVEDERKLETELAELNYKNVQNAIEKKIALLERTYANRRKNITNQINKQE